MPLFKLPLPRPSTKPFHENNTCCRDFFEDLFLRRRVSCTAQVVSNIHLRLWCDAQLAVFSNSFMWLTAVLPYLVVAERYFAGEIEFGVISQVSSFASCEYVRYSRRFWFPPRVALRLERYNGTGNACAK